MTVVDLQGSLGCGICIGRGVYVGVISVCMCVCVCVCVCVCGCMVCEARAAGL